MKLTLISHPLCPYVQRAVIALKEKQASYERIDIDLNAKPAWFMERSPTGKTPLLLADNTAIFESAVICEYLEDIIAPALHPQDALERAKHRAWIEFSSATLNAIWLFYTAKDAPAYEVATKALRERFAQVETVFGEGPFFDGTRFSLVDAAFAPVFRYFDVFDGSDGVGLFDDLPKTRAWRHALAQRLSVRDAVSPTYPALLRAFVIRQDGMLGRRLSG